MKAARCSGSRRQFRRSRLGVFRCLRQAQGTVETRVGLTQRHPCCGDPDCYASLARGYPAQYTPYGQRQQ